MIESIQLNGSSEVPLYRQLYDQIASNIKMGLIGNGARLPATRELAGQLSLNRTTVSAAYGLLEQNGLIRAHVGRGSFVEYQSSPPPRRAPESTISFASSRPSEEHFPIAEFQDTVLEVITSAQTSTILQLGAPTGYPPLRSYLLDQARRQGSAGPDDDILITSGCQQALDLVQRVLASSGDGVACEDPVYHGLRNVFQRAGVRLLGVTMGPDGLDTDELARLLASERPKLLVVTPNFQNPTGASLPRASRAAIVDLCQANGTTLIENDIYGDLRYRGEALPTLKSLDRTGRSLLLGSYSKVAFPGLRVGWIIGPRPVVARLAEAKQCCDLHSDQLSQAILLRFAESGRLETHLKRVRASGAERLRAVLGACERYLPEGSHFTQPDGGMSLWVRLPEPLDADELLARALRESVSYMPSRHFTVSRQDPGGLRLSFGGLSPAQIDAGIAILGRLFAEELQRGRAATLFEPVTAFV